MNKEDILAESPILELLSCKVRLLGILRTNGLSNESLDRLDLGEMLEVFTKHELYELSALVYSKINGKDIYVPREEWISEKYEKIRSILVPEKIRNKNQEQNELKTNNSD